MDYVVLDDVKIKTDENENQHFTPIEQLKPIATADNRNQLQKLCDWWNDIPIKPYVNVRDLSDPTCSRSNDINDIDVGSDGKNAVEVGIAISF